MKLLRFLPITFFAGTHGFALFAPYLALMLAATHFIRRRQRRRAALIPPQPVQSSLAIDPELPLTAQMGSVA
jgi:hypothetical protein